jgi:polyhydroxybutyrate depolymerase
MASKCLKRVVSLGVGLVLAALPTAARELQTVPDGTGRFMSNVGDIGGRSRVFLTYVPKNLKPGAPLLIMFHGGGGDGPMARLGTGGVFDHLADRDGFLVVYPYGIGRSWNTCRKAQSNVARRWDVDDVGFVEAIIEQSARTYGINRKRVFVTGHSNGGQISYRLMLERPDLVAGVAAVSSNLPTAGNMDCVTKNVPTPVMTINGTADPVALYDGGQRPGAATGPTLSTKETMNYFAKLNGQDGEPEITRLTHVKEADPTWVERTAWTQPGKPPVILYTIHGGGHLVPQPYYRYPRVVGRMTEDMNAPEVIWDFFSKLPSRE